MKQGIKKEELTVVLVAGVSPVRVVGLLASPAAHQGEDASQVFQAKGDGSLINLWGAQPDVEKVVSRLATEFGQDKVVVNPGGDEKSRLMASRVD